MGKIIEGRWDCVYCGAKGLRGSVTVCPNCGKSRGKDVKFYISDPHDYVSNPETVEKEPDWLCSYCDTYNKDSESVCKNCGHTREESDENYYEVQREKEAEYNPYTTKYIGKDATFSNTWICPACGSENDERDYKCKNCGSFREERQEYKPIREEKISYNNSGYSSVSQNSFSFKTVGNVVKKRFPTIAVATIALVFVALLIFLLIPKEADFEVTGYEWSRTINIEEYKTVRESDWSVPTGGRVQYTNSEIHHYDHVIDHYETRTRQVSEQVLDGYDTVVTEHRDMGNGYFEEVTQQVPRYRTEYHTETYEEPVYTDVPVYQTKYYYDIEKWVFARSVKTSGTDKEPYFGNVILANNERESGRNSKYTFLGVVKEKNREFDVDFDVWEQYDIGDTIRVKINKLGIITLVKDKR